MVNRAQKRRETKIFEASLTKMKTIARVKGKTDEKEAVKRIGRRALKSQLAW